MTEYTELKRLAEAATPGPWVKQVSNAERWSYVVRPVDGVWPYDNVAYIQEMYEDKCTHKGCHVHNAAYIASASPDVVLSMIAEIERHRCGTEVLQRLHDEDMAERNKLCTQNQALLEALKGLQKQYAEHPDAFWDWSQARAAIKLAEGEDV